MTLTEVLMKDAKALGLIQGAVSDAIFPLISHEDTSKGAWNILMQEFHGNKQVRSVKLQGLRREFEYTRMRDDESLSVYLTRLFDIINQMRSYGEELSRQQVVQKVLISLPSAYDSICYVIEHSKDLDVIEVQEVVASLKSFELRLDRHSENKTERAFASLSVNPKLDKTTRNQSTKDQKNWKAKGNKWDNKSTYGPRNTCKHYGKLHLASVNLRASQSATTVTSLVILQGTAIVRNQCDSSTIKRYIKEVMLVPGLKENLLSVGQIMEHEYYLVFGDHKVEIYDDSSYSNMVAKVQMRGNRSFPMKLQFGIHTAYKEQEMVVGLLEIKAVKEVFEGCVLVFNVFKRFKATIELQSGYKLRKLRSDRGGEYTSIEFNKFCEEMGMERTIVEMTKCMMFEKKMPLEFWAEAVNIVVYILNRCPTKALDKKTPFEAYSGRKPGIKHLRVFGSLCYAHVPNQQRQKLDLASTRCVFLGYGSCEKGYKLYNIASGRVFISRDVVFNEEAG
ncbi:unnamed protein product [Prunus armeniaca]